MSSELHDADRAILADFTRTRDKTIDLLDSLPADWLSRRAEGEEHALGALFQHIASGTAWWMQHVMDDGAGFTNAQPSVDRATIRADLIKTRDRVIRFFDGAAMEATYAYPRPDGTTCPLTGRWCVLYLIQHEAHHRGKIVLALRQWGFHEIPFLPYSGWDRSND